MEAPALKLIVLALATCSCMAVVRGAPDAVGSRAMEVQEGAQNSTSTKQFFMTSTDTLKGEERGPYDFIRSMPSLTGNNNPYQRLKKRFFVPPGVNSDENYLGTTEFAKRAEPFLKSEEGYDMTMKDMREFQDDVVVANIIAKGMRNSNTKDLAIRLGDSQIRQWIGESKSPNDIFKLLELNKDESVSQVFKDPLFNTWAEFVLKKYRLQQNGKLAADSANLIPETVLALEKLKFYDDLDRKVDSTSARSRSIGKKYVKGYEELVRLRAEARKFADADHNAYLAMAGVLKHYKYEVNRLVNYEYALHAKAVVAASKRPA